MASTVDPAFCEAAKAVEALWTAVRERLAAIGAADTAFAAGTALIGGAGGTEAVERSFSRILLGSEDPGLERLVRNVQDILAKNRSAPWLEEALGAALMIQRNAEVDLADVRPWITGRVLKAFEWFMTTFLRENCGIVKPLSESLLGKAVSNNEPAALKFLWKLGDFKQLHMHWGPIQNPPRVAFVNGATKAFDALLALGAQPSLRFEHDGDDRRAKGPDGMTLLFALVRSVNATDPLRQTAPSSKLLAARRAMIKKAIETDPEAIAVRVLRLDSDGDNVGVELSVLDAAILERDLELVEMMVAAGANICWKASTATVGRYEIEKQSTLTKASLFSSLEVLRYLMALADPSKFTNALKAEMAGIVGFLAVSAASLGLRGDEGKEKVAKMLFLVQSGFTSATNRHGDNGGRKPLHRPYSAPRYKLLFCGGHQDHPTTAQRCRS
jgi:hypothetical protein